MMIENNKLETAIEQIQEILSGLKSELGINTQHSVSKNNVRETLKRYSNLNGSKKAFHLLKQFNANTISELNEEVYADFVVACEQQKLRITKQMVIDILVEKIDRVGRRPVHDILTKYTPIDQVNINYVREEDFANIYEELKGVKG